MNRPNLALKGKIVERFGSQVAFAAQLRICPSIVSQVVRGRVNLTVEEKEAWGKTLATPTEALFGGM